MTWIVGKVMPGGYAAAVSDIRVTVDSEREDSEHEDCLQKIYQVGKSMALGFAGSPHLGFLMLERLQVLLQTELDEGERPEVVKEWWPIEAKNVYKKNIKKGTNPECELILLSAHPVNDIGIPDYPRCSVYRFIAPDFSPQMAQPAGILPGVSQALAIGNGNESAPYREMIERADEYGSIREEIERAQFAHFFLVNAIRMVAKRHPHPDVSAAVQLCLVRRGHVTILSPRAMLIDENSVVDFSLPPLLTDAHALATLLLTKHGATAATARC